METKNTKKLCQATVLCTQPATAIATYFDGKVDVSARPCCEEHKGLCQEKADHRRLTVTFAPISTGASL